jgi:hypothetical protein
MFIFCLCSLRIFFLLCQVLLTTLTTPKERMEKIAKASEGFIYLVSVYIELLH